MILRKISATNLKGGDFSHVLADQQAIIGPNFASKTAIVEAIRLCLIGYIPEIGKRPSSTWELSSGPSMEVLAEFDDGTEIQRRFWLEGATVKTSLKCREPVGVFESLPLLNAEAYFQMTDTERTAYVFERIKLPDTYTAEAIMSEVHRLSLEEEHSEQVEKAKGDVASDVQKHFPPGQGAIQVGLGNAIEELRERFSYWNRRAKETIGAVKTLTELKLREKECSTDTLKDLDLQIAHQQNHLDTLNREKGALTAKRDEAERIKGRMRQLKDRLDADRTDYPAIIAKIDKQIKAEEAKRLDLVAEVLLGGETLRRELAGVRATHRTKADAFAARAKQINDLLQALDDLEDATDCPYCHSKTKGWKDKLEAELRGKVDPLEEEQRTARVELETLDTTIVVAEQAIERYDMSVRADSAAQGEIRRLSGARDSHSAAAKKDESHRAELSEELSSLGMIPDEKNLAVEIDKVEAKRVAAATGLSGLNGRRMAAVQLGQDLKRAAQAELEHQDAAAHVLVIKAVANLLKDKREAMIAEAFNGLLTIANKLTDDILKSPLVLHEGTIGMWGVAKFIPHRVFSGTEKALAYIAIAVALSSTAPLRLVILDEFGRLDEHNQYLVLLRLSILVAEEVIDQFIVVGTSLPAIMEDSSVHLEVIKL